MWEANGALLALEGEGDLPPHVGAPKYRAPIGFRQIRTLASCRSSLSRRRPLYCNPPQAHWVNRIPGPCMGAVKNERFVVRSYKPSAFSVSPLILPVRARPLSVWNAESHRPFAAVNSIQRAHVITTASQCGLTSKSSPILALQQLR